MTDGIIQEVFKKYSIAQPYVLDNCVEVYSKFPVEKLQRELIEKIKQEFMQFNTWDRDLIQRILIGDNND